MCLVSTQSREMEREVCTDIERSMAFPFCASLGSTQLFLHPPLPSRSKALRASKGVEASGTHTTPVQHRYSGHASRPLRLGHYLPRSDSSPSPLHPSRSLSPSLFPRARSSLYSSRFCLPVEILFFLPFFSTPCLLQYREQREDPPKGLAIAIDSGSGLLNAR